MKIAEIRHPGSGMEQLGSDPAVWVEMHFLDVYAFCFRLLGHPQDAEDATQETFAAAFREPERWKSLDSARAWLIAVAKNKAISIRRARGRGRSPAIEPAGDAPPLADPLDRERLHAAMARLTEEDREILGLRFLQGHSAEEISRTTGRTPGAVRTGLCRALARLRSLYHGGME